jgi:hypothetical protein
MLDVYTGLEMELKKLHMGTISYGFETMDEVSHQLTVAFGGSIDNGMLSIRRFLKLTTTFLSVQSYYGCALGFSGEEGSFNSRQGCGDESCAVS